MGKTGALVAAVAVNLAIGFGLEADVVAAQYEEQESGTWQGCQPENTSIGGNSSALAYAKLIEKELGVPPSVDCGANVELPIYVNGAKSIGDPGLHQCDNPSLQVGDCMSGSSVQRYVGKGPTAASVTKSCG